jgi:hypothetical protein
MVHCDTRIKQSFVTAHTSHAVSEALLETPVVEIVHQTLECHMGVR